MREILFKAKRLDNGEWISGSLVCFAGGARAILPSDSKTLFSKSKGFICCDTCHDVDPSTVCEYSFSFNPAFSQTPYTEPKRCRQHTLSSAPASDLH